MNNYISAPFSLSPPGTVPAPHFYWFTLSFSDSWNINY